LGKQIAQVGGEFEVTREAEEGRNGLLEAEIQTGRDDVVLGDEGVRWDEGTGIDSTRL